MSDETGDGGLKAGAATLVESSPRQVQARDTRRRARHTSPNLPQKGGRSGPQRGLGGIRHAPPSKSGSAGKRSNRKAADEDGNNRYPEFWRDVQKGNLTVPSSKYVNDPRLLAMAKLDLMRAELRVNFFSTYPVLDEMAVHDLADCKTAGKCTIARKWRSEERIIGLPFGDIVVYPAFQFQSNGEPYPLLLEVNKAFPKDCTDWQRVSWLVSPNEWLDGEIPVSAIQQGDPEVVEAASHAYEVPIG